MTGERGVSDGVAMAAGMVAGAAVLGGLMARGLEKGAKLLAASADGFKPAANTAAAAASTTAAAAGQVAAAAGQVAAAAGTTAVAATTMGRAAATLTNVATRPWTNHLSLRRTCVAARSLALPCVPGRSLGTFCAAVGCGSPPAPRPRPPPAQPRSEPRLCVNCGAPADHARCRT